jgi:hypothetical protein
MKSFKEFTKENDTITEATFFQGKGKLGKKIIALPVMAKYKDEAEAKFIKRVKLEQDNGHAPKGELKDIIIESENINEALDAKKVYDYFLSTMTNIRNVGSYYSQDQAKVDKMNRRILTDYAGDPKKLKEIYKQLANITNILETEMSELEKIIG